MEARRIQTFPNRSWARCFDSLWSNATACVAPMAAWSEAAAIAAAWRLAGRKFRRGTATRFLKLCVSINARLRNPGSGGSQPSNAVG
jgi:hypothetical protein